MKVKAIRDALKEAMQSVDGLRVYDTMPENVQSPAAVVLPDDPFIEYHSTFGNGVATMHFKVTLLVSRKSARAGQDTLDDLLSSGTGETKSVMDAIEASALGNTVDDAIVEEAVDYGVTEVAGDSYFKADLKVTALARRT